MSITVFFNGLRRFLGKGHLTCGHKLRAAGLAPLWGHYIPHPQQRRKQRLKRVGPLPRCIEAQMSVSCCTVFRRLEQSPLCVEVGFYVAREAGGWTGSQRARVLFYNGPVEGACEPSCLLRAVTCLRGQPEFRPERSGECRREGK